LLAKKFGAARGRMAHAVSVHIKFVELCGGDFSQLKKSEPPKS
jgi:hypothetical protein